MIYGTAWKKERTEALVTLALRSGFRAIDTACQPKHYNEAAVGTAVATLIAMGELEREQLFLQTKFTSLDGQDHRVPYDRHAQLPEQVGGWVVGWVGAWVPGRWVGRSCCPLVAS